ncbi:nuclear apoptosis-inducing factor 1-like [Saccostrea cucullata]|uniref:nuclear apoptosis-inducing factor 1-like n=2 Tax=Saccostrea cuccullata TaxID=36930 RepID=UPI002ED63D74
MEERKANWSEVAIETLVDLVTDSERWAVIRGKFSPALTIHTKQKVWIDITERVNASSTCIRAVKDVKKKWQDIQSHTKKKEANRKAELRKTGGGPPPPELKNWEKKIVSILSEDVISGVDGGGGVDSLCTASFPTDKKNTQSGQDLPVSKRRYEEANLEPAMGMEAPSSSCFPFYHLSSF